MKANEQARAKMSGRALIIGGGNVAIDSARVCVRKGADQVDIYCIEKQDEMPAFEWEKSRACIEDIHFHYEFSLIGTKRNKDGSLTCRFAHVKRISKDNNGALNPVIDKQKTVETVADHLIIAAGQRINKDNYQGLPMTQSPISSIDIGSNCMVKDFPGLFAAGDLAVLPGTLVNSIAGGKKAAAAINGFLDGNNSYHSISPRSNRQLLDNIPENLLAVFPKRERHKIPELSYKSAKTSFKEVEKTFGFSAAKGESARCLNCAVCGNCIYEQEQICLQTGSRLF
jgi:NADPH-dependent glutamate synthase beta subunit-like oxidoreductase